MRALFGILRIAGVVAGVAAMVGQLITTYNKWASLGIRNLSGVFVNFFSFFTIDSNVGAVVVFAIGAVLLLRRVDDPRWFAILRASVTAYMVVTFVVYNLLLRGIELPQGTTLPWSNEVLHVVAPLLIIVDWFFAPGRRRLEWRELRIIVAFPILWVVYTLIRGPLAYNEVGKKPTWYPYPFLDPSLSPEGYFSVAFYVILIAGVILAVGAGVIWVSRRGARWPLRAIA
ncbi:Pr6Pr family membrane protein [Lysinimonas soli]|uniref:Pr6Pr family membrane protein n=1 Tax=Lysinimonas soli TaxID=1074233 RepID=A0ABW0NUR9_9MICO